MDLQNQNNSGACRLCDENTGKMHNIFDKTDEGLQILHLIKECLPLMIYRTDPLSKKICQVCFEKLGTFYRFKRTSIAINDKHMQHLRENGESNSSTVPKSIQLFLGCEDSQMEEESQKLTLKDTETSTDDLPVSCPSCKSTYYERNIHNEVELCTDFRQALNTITINKVLACDPDKTIRSTRRRSQAFYHELDDSLCSSLTEYTNTESSQYPEDCASDMDSYESEEGVDHKAKRRKLETSPPQQEPQKVEMFTNEEEFIYNPFSLLELALNVINARNLEGYEPDDFYIEKIEPKCAYCHEIFKNSKLLALHEVRHINIELGEKVDNPIPWHESRDDANVRNKWLTCSDEPELDNEEIGENFENEETPCDDDLLIPVGSEATEEERGIESDIVLENGRAIVRGKPLTEYSKLERNSFYKVIRVKGANRRFCPMCRYTFKGNWGIEAHYLSHACWFTCRYCGMRFNKQRQNFDDHVADHENNGDELSTKIYVASKLKKVAMASKIPPKIRSTLTHEPQVVMIKRTPPPPPKVRPRRSAPRPLIKVKEEPVDPPPPPKTTRRQDNVKSPSQAFFCRKCYKVFFKLDEFNIHNKNCGNGHYSSPGDDKTKVNSNGELLSPTGRPMRHCVKELGTYKDDPDPPLNNHQQQQSSSSFICFICNTPFPTIYSRNSHMRVHKGENSAVGNKKREERPSRSRNSSNKVILPEAKVKMEPLEPEVRIQEPKANSSANALNLAAVSITPIVKNPNQKATINPNIMKLVQNNPHLSIKPNAKQSSTPERSSSGSSGNNGNNSVDDKIYKCSSCSEAFNNKSHLYFHKKNQCGGSKYPCPFCKKRFGTEAAYSSHIFYSHPE